VAAAARRLGVAPGTLRTWDRRYGIGPSGHAPGRHRRYSRYDVARLELMQRALVRGVSPSDAARYALAAPLSEPRDARGSSSGGFAVVPPDPPAGDGRARVGGRVLRLPGAAPRARGLGRAALALDATAVAEVLSESIEGDGVEATWDEVVRPVLVAVGEHWEHTGAGVEVEHLVSECVSRVLGAATARRAVRAGTYDARPVVIAAMPGELHCLPILALSAALAERGVPHRYLGADLPADALAAATRRTGPIAVVLWSQRAPTADVDVLAALPHTRLRPRTFVAGPGWDGVEVPQQMMRLASLGGAVAALCDTVTG
jgi:MerR family transcriptional regulator, light-induced transcriptional regulator